MFLCKKCQASMEEEMGFCPECGTKYSVIDRKIYSNKNCPIEITEQFLFVDEKKPKIQLTFRGRSEEPIDACVITVKGKNQFGDEVEDTQQIYADLNCFEGESFGADIVIEPKDINLRMMDVVVNKVAYNDGAIWENTDLVRLEETTETFNDVKENSKIVYKELLELYPKKEKDNTLSAEKIQEYKNNLVEKLSSFEEFYVPEDENIIGQHMFDFPNDSLKDLLIHIPDSVKSIGSYAFKNCRVYKIPDSCSDISAYAFNNVYFESFTVPKDIRIGGKAFTECTVPKEYGDLSFIGGEKINFKALSNINGLRTINFSDDSPIHFGGTYPCENMYDLNKTYIEWRNKYFRWKDEEAKKRNQITVTADKKINNKEYYDLEEINMLSEQHYIEKKGPESVFGRGYHSDIFFKTVGGALFYKAHLSWSERDINAEKYIAGSGSKEQLWELIKNGGEVYKELDSKDFYGLLLLPPKLEKLYISSEFEQIDLSNQSSECLKYISLEGDTKLKVDLNDYPNLKMIYSAKSTNITIENPGDRVIDLYCNDSQSVKGHKNFNFINTELSYEEAIEKYIENKKYWEEHSEEKKALEEEKNQLNDSIKKKHEKIEELNNTIQKEEKVISDIENELNDKTSEKMLLLKEISELSIFQKKDKKTKEALLNQCNDTISQLEESVKREKEKFSASSEIKNAREEIDELKKQESIEQARAKEINSILNDGVDTVN